MDFVRNIIQQKIKERFITLERKRFGHESDFPVIACLLKQPPKGEAHNRTTEIRNTEQCTL